MCGERKWQEGIRRVYGTGAEEIFDVQRDNHSFYPVVRQQEIHRILEALPALREKAATRSVSTALPGNGL
ncbi:hypothetical protein [Eubacterium aggregans]|uniref:hypothetical protein n=1 Tax=Eubacterium aggregans TaxID=81409 RepID=UPI003F332D53